LVDSIHIKTSLVRLVGAKAMAQAAGMPMTRPIRVEPTETMIELVACLM
jgi:hypothetical protein